MRLTARPSRAAFLALGADRAAMLDELERSFFLFRGPTGAHGFFAALRHERVVSRKELLDLHRRNKRAIRWRYRSRSNRRQ